MALRRAATMRKATMTRSGLPNRSNSTSAAANSAAWWRAASASASAGAENWARLGAGSPRSSLGAQRADFVDPWARRAHRGLATMAAAAPGPLTRSITMIKKLTPDGEQCRKCNDIEARLERDGLLDQIDTHIYMDLDDPNDPGTQLATKHDVKVAPFFVVQNLDGHHEVIDEEIYTVYLKMKKQVFDVAATKDEEAADVALSIF
jgi:hypothetical protein